MIWLVLIVGGFLSSIVLISAAFEWPKLGVCESCEYDMRGSPSLLCPECGHANPSWREERRQLRHPVMLALGIAVLVASVLPVLVTLIPFAIYVLSGVPN